MEKIDISLKFCGALKEFFTDHNIQVGEEILVGELIDKLLNTNYVAKTVFDVSQVAIGLQIVRRDFKISVNCEVVFMPPFSGG
jgi:molybdopterin converting factor small subunit